MDERARGAASALWGILGQLGVALVDAYWPPFIGTSW